jgi:aminoglycoside phosphotransferase (APT) family kinase protein
MDLIDQATVVRKGEELDAGKVEEFLKGAIPRLKGPMKIQQFPRGHSNLTYLISFEDREMILRRPPFGTKAKSAHDMGREFRVLSAVHPVYPYAPRPLAYCEDPAVLDCPFYVMERIQGIIIRKDLPAGLELSSNQAERLCRRLVEVFCELHAIDYHRIGLANFGKPEGYIQRQVQGWSRRYRNARTPDAPMAEEVMDWLSTHMPPNTDRPALIHNDFKLDNVVLDTHDPTRIIGVFDWEMATIGDPLMDLGASLAYWVESDDSAEMQAIRFMPTTLAGIPSRKELIQQYSELSGRPVRHYDFFYCFGLFRLAVIAQQIYYRYYHGQTADRRFKSFILAVQALVQTAAKIIGHH